MILLGSSLEIGNGALHSNHSPIQQHISHTQQSNTLNNSAYIQINGRHKLKCKEYNKTGLYIGQTGINLQHDKGQVFCAIKFKTGVKNYYTRI
jgi:hypothetical protein